MLQSDSQQETALRLLKRVNRILIVSGMLSFLLSFIISGVSVLLLLLLFIAAIMVIAVRSRLHSLHLGLYALCLLISLLAVWCIALAGFYGPHTEAVAEFGAGTGTRVVNKNVNTALTDVLTQPQVFTAAIFGYDCNGLWGPDCSSDKWVMGILTDYAILTAGVIIGNGLVKKQIAASTVTLK